MKDSEILYQIIDQLFEGKTVVPAGKPSISALEAVIYCKDCGCFDAYNVKCRKGHDPKPPYDSWFCADGEMRDDDA